jgi:hypothetical protein
VRAQARRRDGPLAAAFGGGVISNLAERLFRSRPHGVDAGDLDFGDRILKVASAYADNLETLIEEQTSALDRALWGWKPQDPYAGFVLILNAPGHSAAEL